MSEKSIIPKDMSSQSIIPSENMVVNSIIPSIERLTGISISQMGSSLAGMMFILATVQQFCPNIVHTFMKLLMARLTIFFRPEISITFCEFESYSWQKSEAYTAVEAYVGTLSMDLTRDATHLKASKASKKSSLTDPLNFTLEDFEEISDRFKGVEFKWRLGKLQPNSKTISHCQWTTEKRYFRLTFKKKYRRMATNVYLKHVMEEGQSIMKKRKTRMLYTNNQMKEGEEYTSQMWRKSVFEHPATFDNLALDPAKKQEIIDDLTAFTKAKDYYQKIGKAWKRGYLLYGPPGTGKTTMVACMANLLGYDVYDIELTTVKNNSQLRNLLISTSGKSIILIEDIDCTLPITAKREKQTNKSDDSGKKSDDSDKKSDDSGKKSDDNDESSDSDSNSDSDSDSDSDDDNSSSTPKIQTKVTLSGLLNIIDGMWSPCSQERIIVFTTNHIDKLDPALIRTGRMDKHIEMSYCTFEAFKIFAKNYLDIDSHPLFDRIKKLLSEINIGPSDVAENLLPKSSNEDPEMRLKAVIQALEEKK